jgi:hypothetical protein
VPLPALGLVEVQELAFPQHGLGVAALGALRVQAREVLLAHPGDPGELGAGDQGAPGAGDPRRRVAPLLLGAPPRHQLGLVEEEPAPVPQHRLGVAVGGAVLVPALGRRPRDAQLPLELGPVDHRAALVRAALGSRHAQQRRGQRPRGRGGERAQSPAARRRGAGEP